VHFVGVVTESKLKVSASTVWVRRHPVLPICRHCYVLTNPMEQSPSWETAGSQVVKKSSALYGTRWFITAFKSARHLFLSWARSIQCMHLHPTSWTSILILSFHLHLGLSSGLFLLGFTTKTLYAPLLPHTCYTRRSSCRSYLQDTTQMFRIVTMFVIIKLQTFRTHIYVYVYDRLPYHISHC
jgi:hypothetical protein